MYQISHPRGIGGVGGRTEHFTLSAAPESQLMGTGIGLRDRRHERTFQTYAQLFVSCHAIAIHTIFEEEKPWLR